MGSYKKRKLMKKIYRHSNTIIYGVIFLIASIITVAAATDRVKKTEYIEALSATEESIDIADSDVKKVASSQNSNPVEEVVTEVQTTEAPTVKPEAPIKKGNKFVVNTTGTLNVRQQPSTSAELAGKLEEGNGGTVIEPGSEWTKIKSGNLTGFVATQYILIGNENDTEIKAASSYVATINTETLKVREKKSTDCTVLGMVAIGEKYKVVSQTDEWIQIKYEGKTGFVSSEFVKIKQKISTGMTIKELEAKEAAKQEAAAKAEAEKAALKAEEEQETKKVPHAENNKVSSSSNKTSTPSKRKTPATVNVDETYLLECIVACEAGSEPYEGKLAVANVILNRVNGGWGNSIKSVVYASGQFGPVTNGSLERMLSSGPDAGSKRAAHEALAGNNNVSGYYSFGISGTISTKNLSKYRIIGSHTFY